MNAAPALAASPVLLSFVIPGDARGKGRPRATARGKIVRLYTDAKTASYENLVALAARQALGSAEPLDGALSACIRVFITPPVSASLRARKAMLAGELHPTKKPDLDNVVKAVLDGCNGVAFRDDALVVSLTASKAYADRAGVSVMIGAGAMSWGVRPSRKLVESTLAAVALERGVNPEWVVDSRLRVNTAARWEVWRRVLEAGDYSLAGLAGVWGCHHTSILAAKRKGFVPRGKAA